MLFLAYSMWGIRFVCCLGNSCHTRPRGMYSVRAWLVDWYLCDKSLSITFAHRTTFDCVLLLTKCRKHIPWKAVLFHSHAYHASHVALYTWIYAGLNSGHLIRRVNTLRYEHNGRYFPDDSLEGIFGKWKMESFEFQMQFNWNVFLKMHLISRWTILQWMNTH